MSSIGHFLSSLFFILFWLAIILGGIALWKYNVLQKLAQEVKEMASNIQVAVSKKVQLVNQLGDVVKSFQQAEQLTVLKVSDDNTAQAVVGAYRDSTQMLTAIQSMASRFPNLKANEQYHRLIDSIQQCESNIEDRRNRYNKAVKDYNSERGSIPAVFVARVIGFPVAPSLQFDVSGAEETQLRRFDTPDGEQLIKLLGDTSGRVGVGVRKIASSAVEVGTIVATKAVSAAGAASAGNRVTIPAPAAERYFYMTSGAVPKGPLPLADIQQLIASGGLTMPVQVAREGSDVWTAIAEAASLSS